MIISVKSFLIGVVLKDIVGHELQRIVGPRLADLLQSAHNCRRDRRLQVCFGGQGVGVDPLLASQSRFLGRKRLRRVIVAAFRVDVPLLLPRDRDRAPPAQLRGLRDDRLLVVYRKLAKVGQFESESLRRLSS